MTRLTTSLMSSLLALSAAVLLPSCANTSSSDPGYDKVVDYTTPKTNLSKEEYPFDENGNYLEKYAARGSGTADNKPPKDKPLDTAMYTQPAEDSPGRTPTYEPASYTPEKTSYDDEPEKVTYTPSRSSGGSSSTAERKPVSKPKPKVASKPKPKPKVASKPKPKPKPAAPKPTYVKVKPGDTLYGLSSRYGVSVASIKSANGLSGDTIRDGKSLKIPPKKK